MACVDVRDADARVDAAAAIAARLRQFSPDVEPSRGEPGVFWLNASGLSHLYQSPLDWAERIVAALRADGYRETTVAVGFTRFGAYAIARRLTAIDRQTTVIRDRASERALAGKVPLDRLDLDGTLIDSLEKLGVRTVRAFLELPAEGVRRRFGQAAYDLHRRASGDLAPPLQPVRPPEPLLARHDFDPPETDVNRLLFIVKRLLDRLRAATAERREMLAELTLHLRLDLAREVRTEPVRPAAPTLDIAQLMTLVRLRLESVSLDGGVVDLQVAARSVGTVATQQGLFVERPPRDPAVANRALARVRARFGDAAVARARLTEGHLPEARFAWEPAGTIPFPESRDEGRRHSAGHGDDGVTPPPDRRGNLREVPMVRRIYANPRPLPTGPSAEHAGPYLVAGGWWRTPVNRAYYFVQMRGGDLLWIYYDRARRRWRCQGRVE